MAAQRKFDPETRERAVRMYQDRITQGGDSKRGARRYVGEIRGINEATLRNWVEDRYGTGTSTPAGNDQDSGLSSSRCAGRTLNYAGPMRF